MTECIAEPLSRENIRTMAKKIRIIEGSYNQYYFENVYYHYTLIPTGSNYMYRHQ